MVLVAVVGVLLLILSIVLIVNFKNKKQLCELFENGNVIVFGKKRKGKDMLFNSVINARKKACYSNIQFNKKWCDVKEIEDLNIPFTYEQFLENRIKPIERSEVKFDDNKDYYLSDGGIYLPSQYNNELVKKYPSLPILYALSSQVFGFNIHVNTQALNRVWDKLREQADTYIKALKTIKIFGFFIVKYRIYDKYESAMHDLRVFKTSGGLFKPSNDSKAQRDNYNALNGIIEEHFIIMTKKNIYYDTRAFRKKLIKEGSEKNEDINVSDVLTCDTTITSCNTK